MDGRHGIGDRPLHVSIVGGEPLVRYKELGQIVPLLEQRNIHIQLVTSAVRPIPMEWALIKNMTLVVSIDGSSRNMTLGANQQLTSEFFRTLPGIGSRCTIQ